MSVSSDADEDKIVKYFMEEDDSSSSSSSSSSDSSNSSDDDDEAEAILLALNQQRQSRNCVSNFVENVVPSYTDREFVMHFRIGRDLMQQLAEKFSDSETYQKLLKNENSRANISAMKHMLVFLWFSGHETASYRDVADRFDVCLYSLHRIISRVSSFLSAMADQVITWPNDDAKARISHHFMETNGFPNVLGAIDGTHILLDRPSKKADDYINRKGFPSMIVQGTCDELRHFTSIFIGYPGSVHDARVFRNSDIYPRLPTLCEGGYILGDSAYPCTNFLLTPHRDNGHLTAAQKLFNKTLSSCRVIIEHTFGIMKQRFRQLYHLKLRGHSRIAHYIRALCVLHNIARAGDMDVFEGEERPSDEQPDIEDCGEAFNEPQNGIELRNELTREFFIRRRQQRE